MDPQPLQLVNLGDPDRPKGLHVSQIYTDILQTVDPKRYDPNADMPLLKIAGGLALERAIEKVLYTMMPGKAFRPPPVKKDGIWLSPDNVVMDPWRGREFKMTWYSMKKECPYHDVYWPWRVQMMAYAYALDTLLFELWVFFVNGRYPFGPPQPQIQPYLLTFTQQEVWENWMMLVNHAKYRGWLK